jgi:hypothetical protein
VAALAARYGVSRRQAFRYLRLAQNQSNPLPVPLANTVFTVTLPDGLADPGVFPFSLFCVFRGLLPI